MKASRNVNNPWDLEKKKHKRILQKKNTNAHINVSFVLVLKFCFLFLFSILNTVL